MPFEGEPRNGDYASYIDGLVNRNQGTPGHQRLLPSRNHAPVPSEPGRVAEKRTRRAARQADDTHRPATARPATLAEQGSAALTGMFQMLMGAFFVLLAAISGFAALDDAEPLHPVNLIRTVIPILIARALFKRGSARFSGSTPDALPRQAPLPARPASTRAQPQPLWPDGQD